MRLSRFVRRHIRADALDDASARASLGTRLRYTTTFDGDKPGAHHTRRFTVTHPFGMEWMYVCVCVFVFER